MSEQKFSEFKIFDIHTHIYPERIAPAAVKSLEAFYDNLFPSEGNGTAEELRRVSEESGVVGCLLLAVATNAHQIRRVNDYVALEAGISRSLGRKTVAFGSFHQDCDDPERELRYAFDIGLKGIKIHPDIQRVHIDDERLFPVYAACRDEDLPVCLHMGDSRPQYPYSDARRLLRVMEKFPGLRVLGAHFGAYSVWEDARLLATHPDIFFDTSSALSFISPEYASELVHTLGADKCMFGTDYPIKIPKNELELFMKLDLNQSQRRAILYDNAARFLKIDQPSQ